MKIIDAKLYQELIRRESKFKDNIDKVFNYSEDLLPQAVNVFNNYTQHDVDHSIAVMNYMFEFINDINQINDLEITIMIYTALLHDIGMVENGIITGQF